MSTSTPSLQRAETVRGVIQRSLGTLSSERTGMQERAKMTRCSLMMTFERKGGKLIKREIDISREKRKYGQRK